MNDIFELRENSQVYLQTPIKDSEQTQQETKRDKQEVFSFLHLENYLRPNYLAFLSERARTDSMILTVHKYIVYVGMCFQNGTIYLDYPIPKQDPLLNVIRPIWLLGSWSASFANML